MTTYPYVFYACPCSESEEQDSEEERSFNPHDPQTNYSLHTLDYLLFCDDCNQIRCSRCCSDEIINWYCPSCLFEVPSSGVRADGNRCSRNCYNCPLCSSPVVTTAVDTSSDGLLKPEEDEEYILACQYCDWTTLELGVRLNKPNKITEQLNKARSSVNTAGIDEDGVQLPPTSDDARFTSMLSFYKEQLAEVGDGPNHGSAGYGSPANLARIINLYGGLTHAALKKSQSRHRPMQEAKREDGLLALDSKTDHDHELIEKIASLGWDATASKSEQMTAPSNFNARFRSELWPVATHLRTKRGKRCRQCRQFVTRPDAKIQSTKYRIRILAMNNIPKLSIRPLHSTQAPDPSFILRLDQQQPETLVQPFQAKQYVMTFRNPIFETVKVTLATPSTTPGKIATRVTILSPSFSIGPAGDVWDDALSSSTMSVGNDGSRRAAMQSLTANAADSERQPEAGKIWEQTRNTTSVVVEIVPGSITDRPDQSDLMEGDYVLEIPIYVRVEWTAEVQTEGEQKNKGEREPRELAYWCVVGVGRISEAA